MFSTDYFVNRVLSRLIFSIQPTRRPGAYLRGKLVIGSLCSAVLLTLPADAQSTFGSIRGIASDSTGATIPGASVVLHSVDENTDRTIASDADGSFLFSNIKPGQYVVTVAHLRVFPPPNFRTSP